MISLDFCPARPCAGGDCPTYRADMMREDALVMAINVSAGSPTDSTLIRHTLHKALSTRAEIPDGTAFHIHTLPEADASTTYVALGHDSAAD